MLGKREHSFFNSHRKKAKQTYFYSVDYLHFLIEEACKQGQSLRCQEPSLAIKLYEQALYYYHIYLNQGSRLDLEDGKQLANINFNLYQLYDKASGLQNLCKAKEYLKYAIANLHYLAQQNVLDKNVQEKLKICKLSAMQLQTKIDKTISVMDKNGEIVEAVPVIMVDDSDHDTEEKLTTDRWNSARNQINYSAMQSFNEAKIVSLVEIKKLWLAIEEVSIKFNVPASERPKHRKFSELTSLAKLTQEKFDLQQELGKLQNRYQNEVNSSPSL